MAFFVLTPPLSFGANASRTARIAGALRVSRYSPSLLKLALFLACACGLSGGAGAHAQAVLAAPRIVHAIDDNDLVTLKGNTHPAANAKNDQRPVSPGRCR
jgi:hypothetical protein